METMIFSLMKRQKTVIVFCLLMLSSALLAQQLPNAGFESWGGSFNGDPQPDNWNGSNVTQAGFKFTFLYQDVGRTGGKSARVADKEVGAAGITEPAPGYMSLGQPWSYLESIAKIGEATAGTDGGISFKFRPDTMAVWIKRTGGNTDKEYYNLVFYSWKGTSIGTSYTGKNGGCTSTTHTNEESDIRQALNGNTCNTSTFATQIAEGWVKEKKTYGEWTRIKVPIYYMNDEIPSMCNVILSAGNYPNFRANSGLYPGNTLYVDDIELIYSSAINELYVNNKKWAGFDPNLRNGEEQTYALGLGVTTVPMVSAKRGIGSITNAKGTTANFNGRTLSGSEITITNATEVGGTSGNNITTIVVRAEDGSSTSTYKIKFVAEQSTNYRPSNITYNVGGIVSDVPNFSGFITTYNIELPYGTTAIPTIEAIKGDDGQEFVYTQATSLPGTAKVKSTAADNNYSATYIINFTIGQLDDNKLTDIKIGGNSLPGFSPTKTNYTVELPLGTTALPTIEAISAYPAGVQTITTENTVVIAGETCTGTYNISVKVPGNTTTRVYRLTFKITASTYSYLKDIKIGGVSLEGFDPATLAYAYVLPQGTTVLPTIEAIKGDAYQQTPLIEPGGVDGVTKITVTAASGAQSIYRITFSAPKSSNALLQDLRVNGITIPNFDANTLTYDYEFPIGTIIPPIVTYTPGDAFQTITKTDGGLNGATRVIVQAQNGSVKTYVINFSVARADNTTLLDIKIGGISIPNFSPNTYNYTYKLERGTTILPLITYTAHDAFQTITVRNGGIEGETKIIVKSQIGTSATYSIVFSVDISSNASLQNIFIGGAALNGFNPDVLNYSYELPIGTLTLPVITWTAGDVYQTITKTDGGITGTSSIVVRSEDGTKTNTYRITFTVAQANNATLNDIQIGGVSIAGFQPNTLEYSVMLERGTTVLPPITYTLHDEWQKVRIISAGVSGDTRIVVTAQTGATNTYIIHFSVDKSTICHLSDIQIGNISLIDFNSTVLNYNYTLKSGTTTLPEITYTKGDEAQKVILTKGGINGVTTLRVIAESGAEATYTINFTVEKSENAFLKNIFINDVAINNFDKNVFNYTYRLKPTETSCPKISVEKDLGQSVSISKPILTGDVRIVVTPESGGSNTYTIKIMYDLSDNTALNALQVGGELIAGFTSDKFEYTYNLPTGTQTLPAITYTAGEMSQEIAVTKGDTTYVRVEAADGSESVYTIYFNYEKSNNAHLADIKVGGISLSSFNANTLEYDYELTDGTTSCPTVEAVKGDVTQQVSIVKPTLTGHCDIKVLSETGIETLYTINFYFNKSTVSTLTALKVDGTNILENGKLDYNYQLTAGTTVLPTIEYEKGNAKQTVTTLTNGVNGKTSVIVKAENGNVTTYTINFAVTQSNVAKLQSIHLDGVALAGFDPNTFDYLHTLAFGATQAPIITATGAEPTQQITVIDAPSLEGTAHIKVVAQDGTVGTYSIKFTNTIQTNVTLKNIAANNTTITGFDPNKTDYTIELESGTAAPSITYEAYDSTQVIAVADAGLKGTTIVVTAQNGDQRRYTINYTVLPSSNALLSNLQLYNGNEFESLAGFTTNTAEYTHSLEWRTKHVPAIHPISAHAGQTVTIHYGAVNDTTRVHVVAEDGTSKDYAIYFPVVKSSVATLSDLSIDDAELYPAFEATEFNYVATLDYGTTSIPAIRWTQGEDFGKQLIEQKVQIIAPSLQDTAHVVVTAEDGTQKTYNITFVVRESGKPNVLQSIFVDKYHFDGTTTQTEFQVELPFGATTMSTINVVKTYPEQTVLIDNGGIYAKTIITVKSNQQGVADAVYTLIPTIAKPQAALENIIINGTPISDFNPYKYQYIVNVDNGEGEVPTLEYTHNSTTSVIEDFATGVKSSTITVTGKDDSSSNTYKIVYYYTNDVLPNGEFVNWTNAEIYTAAKKPTGWTTIADAVDATDIKSNATIFGLPIGSLITVGTYTPDAAITQSGDRVRLRTIYNSSLKGSIPGLITLGEIAAKLGMESTTTDVSGGILFRNTPDMVSMRYQPVSKSNVTGSHFVYSLNNGAYKKEFTDNNFNNSWKIIDLPLLDNLVEAPTMMNIIINSCEAENSSSLSNNASSEMFVDWIRLSYNSKIAKILVNGKATKGFRGKYDGGWVQAVNVDAELQGEPTLTFVGEVADQEYSYYFDEEVENCSGSKTRVAYITSKAEDGTLSQYIVNLNRPYSTNANLMGIMVNDETVAGFTPTTTTYTIVTNPLYVPDIMAIRGNMHQTITYDTISNNLAVIKVTAENGTEKTYTLHFVKAMSADATLKNITIEGVTDFAFVADKINYVVQLPAETGLPNVTFEKQSDGQLVDMMVDTVTTLLTTAENGTDTKTYTITFEFGNLPTTSGKLTEIKIDGIPVSGFNKDNANYESTKRASVDFVREFDADTVTQIITADSIVWHVSGGIRHDYKLIFTKTLSNSVLLKTILVGNDTLDIFHSYETDYEITSDTIDNIQAVYAEAGQTIEAEFELGDTDYHGTFKFLITAPDGITKDSTMVRVRRQKSNSGKLSAILLNDEVIRINGTGYNSNINFNADSTQYVITLPCTNPKLVNPKMPNIQATAGANGQHITIEQNGINATSYIVVRPENGSVANEMSYELVVVAAKSNNNNLANIVVNGESVTGFQVDNLNYSIDLANNSLPTVEFVTEDQFSTVTALVLQDSALLIVKAEDGTEKTYCVKFNITPISNDATLSDLTVNGTSVSGFSGNLLNYNLTLAQGTTTLPNIEAFKAHDGQTLNIIKNGVSDTTFVQVTAEDGVTTQTYKIAFNVTKSNNADLVGISVNYQPISTFDANNLRYHVVLPTTMTPNVIGVKAEGVQRIDKTIYGADSVYLKVTAEDGITTKTYVVTFEVQAAQNAYLGGLLLDDVSIEGFDANILNYVVTLPAGSTVTPEVTAISGSNGQNIIITNNGVRDTTTIVVTAQDGITTLTYTVFFAVELSDIDTLSMINLDGDPLANFDANTTVYNISLPVGTRTFPVITWEKGERMEHTVLDTVNITKYEATFNIRVESEKFHATGIGNSRTYSVKFTIEKSSIDTLAMIYVNGDSIDNFQGNTLRYNIVLSVGTRVLPTIEHSLADTLQTAVIEIVDANLSDYTAQTNIKVTAENGSQKIYEIHFTVEKSTIDTLKNLTINGLSITTTGVNYTADKAFNGTTFEYHVQWAIGSAKNPLPEITYEVGDSLQTAQPQTITVNSLSDTISIVVTAENGNSNTYIIYQELLHSDVNTLAMIYVNDAPLATFNADTLTYNITLPVGTRHLPKIEFDKGDVWQTAVLDTMLTDKYTSKFAINVTAESGKQRTYTLNFTVKKSAVDTLSMITIDGLPLAGFNSQVGVYNYTLPIGTSELPAVAYELGDTLQKVQATSHGVNGAYSITVTAENGKQNVYVINFTVAKSNNAYLSNIFYNATQAVDNFDEELFNYIIKLPYGTVEIPSITIEKGDPGQRVEITQATTLQDTVVITVKAEDNVTTATYKVTFELLKSDNALLNMIYLNGEKIDSLATGFTTNINFAPEAFEYNIELPFGTTTLPTITWEGQVTDYKSITLVTSGINGTAMITVVSDDESNTNEYHLTFSVAKSSNNKLANLLVNGVTIEGFHSDSLNYTIVYPIGTDSAALITATDITYIAGDSVQTVVVSQSEPTTILVTVTAENGVTQVYVINLEIARSNYPLLKDIKLDGVSLKGFEPNVFEYTFLLFNGKPIPEIEAVKGQKSQTVQITINPVGELTYIFVTAEDGTEAVYKIDFRYSTLNPGDAPTKDDVYWMPLGSGTYKASSSRNNVKVAIFTPAGQLVEMRDVPVADPNDNIKEEGSAGAVFNFSRLGKVLIYVFYFNDKEIVIQGKFIY